MSVVVSPLGGAGEGVGTGKLARGGLRDKPAGQEPEQAV